MRTGLEVLGRSVGNDNPQYLAGENLLARVLDRHGMHEEAMQLRKHIDQALGNLRREECVGCTVSAASLH